MAITPIELKHSYSQGIERKRIGVLGNYPPPLGGVSVHIQRVMDALKTQHNTVYHFDTSKRGNSIVYCIKLFFFLICKRLDIVYYHTIDLNRTLYECRFLLWMKKYLNYRFVVVEHNCRYLYTKNKSYKKKFNACMQRVDQLVLIGHSTWQSYIKNRIIVPKCTTIESAFLPPDVRFECAIIATYQTESDIFLTNHSPIIMANAFQLSMLDGKDLYGIDLCIQSLIELKKEFPRIGLLIVMAQLGDKKYYDHLQQEIAINDLTDNVCFVIGKQELWPLLKKADLFVRPTLSDGESVSVQEALYFSIPVVASDAVSRPPQATIFASGDAQDLYHKSSTMLLAKYIHKSL